MTSWTGDDWRVHALAAVSEGYRPHGHGPLAASAEGTSFCLSEGESPWPGGWCGECQIWWRCSGQSIVANYPDRGSYSMAVVL